MQYDQESLTPEAAGELRRHNLQLRQRVTELSQRLAAVAKDLESLNHCVSHDLGAPLRAIDNFSSILQSEYGNQLDAEGRRLITIVRRNAARLGALIQDMLAFAQAADREPIPATIDLQRLVHDVLAELEPALAGRPVSLQVHPMPAVTADTALIRMVWLNLLANAIKFTRPCERACIEVNAQVVGNEVVCSVKDNGVGFEPEYADKLFRLFQRLHDAEQFEGNGIGLGIVKRSIDKHGGRVWAEGAPGAGATFYFSLPLTREVLHASDET